MPDIWTKHPDIVRDLLQAGSFKCGVEPRILKGRDANWTCIVDGKTISGDIYVHRVEEILKGSSGVERPGGIGTFGGWEFIVLGVLFAVVIGQAWTIRKLRRQGP